MSAEDRIADGLFEIARQIQNLAREINGLQKITIDLGDTSDFGMIASAIDDLSGSLQKNGGS